MNKNKNPNLFVVAAVFSFIGAAVVQGLFSVGALTKINGLLDGLIVAFLIAFGIANLVFLKKRDNPTIRMAYIFILGALGLLGLYFLLMIMYGFGAI